jgi:cytochrome oxidase Cu insertion factor (SCO1/SenC/PrrC family)
VRRRALGLALLLALGAAAADAAPPLDVLVSDFQLVPLAHEPPPPFSLETLDGKKLGPGDLVGRPVLLYFWATW